MNIENLISQTIAILYKPVKSQIAWSGLISALLFGFVVSAEVYKADIRSVEVKMLAPVSEAAESYSSLANAQAAMLARGANRALFSFTLKIPEQVCPREDVGLYLGAFKKPADFLAANPDTGTAVYVDSDLGDGVKGEEFSKTLFEKGYKTIYLATGHQPESFPPMPHIKKIIGKEPPWE